MINIFKGKDNDFSKAVCLNAAAGLMVAEKHSIFNNAYKDADASACSVAALAPFSVASASSSQ